MRLVDRASTAPRAGRPRWPPRPRVRRPAVHRRPAARRRSAAPAVDGPLDRGGRVRNGLDDLAGDLGRGVGSSAGVAARDLLRCGDGLDLGRGGRGRGVVRRLLGGRRCLGRRPFGDRCRRLRPRLGARAGPPASWARPCAGSGAAASGSARWPAPRRRTGRRPAAAAGRAASPWPSGRRSGPPPAADGVTRERTGEKAAASRTATQRSGPSAGCSDAVVASASRVARAPGNGTPAFGGTDDSRRARTTRPTSRAASTSAEPQRQLLVLLGHQRRLERRGELAGGLVAGDRRVVRRRRRRCADRAGRGAPTGAGRPRPGRASRRRAAGGASPRPSSSPRTPASPACPRP